MRYRIQAKDMEGLLMWMAISLVVFAAWFWGVPYFASKLAGASATAFVGLSCIFLGMCSYGIWGAVAIIERYFI